MGSRQPHGLKWPPHPSCLGADGTHASSGEAGPGPPAHALGPGSQTSFHLGSATALPLPTMASCVHSASPGRRGCPVLQAPDAGLSWDPYP